MATPKAGSWTATDAASDLIEADGDRDLLSIQVTSGVAYFRPHLSSDSGGAVVGSGLKLDAVNGPTSVILETHECVKMRWSMVSTAGASGSYLGA